MKKYYILSILFTFLCLTFNLSAQTSYEGIFGLKVGINYTKPKMVDLKSMEFNNQTGLDFGIYTNFRLNKVLGLKLEVLYTAQNIQMESYGVGDGNGQTIGRVELNEKIKDEFLVLPILLRIKILEKWDALVGPQFGYLISNNNRFLIIDNVSQFQNEQIDNFSFSGNIELLFNATSRMDLGLRYNFGLNKINSLRNNGFQFYLGYDIFR